MAKVVMIVDDSRTIRTQIKMALLPHEFEIVEAENGLEAVTHMRDNPKIRMIFMDINMPVMNGLEALKTIAGDDTIDPKPNIMMLTTEDSMTMVEEAKKVGAKGWIVKPYTSEKLVTAAKKLTGTS